MLQRPPSFVISLALGEECPSPLSTPEVLLTPDDRIVFAGEHLSTLQGWQEGAILSAYHAIDLVVRQTRHA